MEHKNSINDHRKLYFFFLLLIFIVSAVDRLSLAIQYGSRFHFYDELLHWQIGQSIYSFGQVIFRGFHLSYSEILYSLLIAIAHVFSDGKMAYESTLFINAVVMSSAVFPIYFMANRITKNRWLSILVCFMAMFSAEMTLSTRIMQENLYFPMIMGFFCYFTFLITKKNITNIDILFFSSYTFLCSLCKQIALNLVVGMLVFFIYSIFTQREKWKTVLIQAISFLGTFFIWKLIYNIVFQIISHPQKGKNDSNIILDALTLLFNFAILKQLLYPALFYIGMVLLITGVFTIVLPFGMWKLLKPEEKSLCILSLAILFSSIAMICFLVVPQENLNTFAMRFHYRYIWYIIFPFLIIFLGLFKRICKERINLRIIPILICLSLFSIIINIFPIYSTVDCPSMELIKSFESGKGQQVLCRVIILVFIWSCAFFLYTKRIKIFYTVIISCLVLNGIASGVIEYKAIIHSTQTLSQSSQDAYTLSEYLSKDINSKDQNVLFIADDIISNGVQECWLKTPYYFCKTENLAVTEAGKIDTAHILFETFGKTFNITSNRNWDYIISQNKIDMTGYDLLMQTGSSFLYKANGTPIKIKQLITKSGVDGDNWVQKSVHINVLCSSKNNKATLEITTDSPLIPQQVLKIVDSTGKAQIITLPADPQKFKITINKKPNEYKFTVNLTPKEGTVVKNDPRNLTFRLLNLAIIDQ